MIGESGPEQVKSNTVTMITEPIYEFHLAKCPLL